MRTYRSFAAVLLLAPVGLSQLTDLQPGRNFPTAAIQFGTTGRSENIDVADIDNDGDLDVGIANGGDGAAQPNDIHINNGNLQAGTEGTFTNESAMRFVGAPDDTSRDIEFADFDGDADLDIYISNRGSTVNGGEVSRAYVNQGGFELGTTGFYRENTGSFWGNLVSVPLADEAGVQDGMGPFRDFSCDCDFADIDDDGDLDLFHSSYGPNIAGNRDSRIFLNDGSGRFNEMWPWMAAGGDIQLHTLDIDLADFDGDYDLDVFASSRNSQARVWLNQLDLDTGSWASDPFIDVTQTSLLDTGSALSGSANYEAEFADVDGDGDFDVWVKNYTGVADDILENDGSAHFTKTSWITGDPTVDENEIDFIDFDSDGDLDAFLANFSGTNWIYQNGAAQGTMMMPRAGTAGSGGDETPTTSNGGTTLDGEVGDIDGDGDPDILLANDNNQPNRLWVNALGTPDTHAPTFQQITVQADKVDGSDTVIRAQVRDNSPYYIIDYYLGQLFYTVDGANETCIAMFAQRGQQFRAVIPGAINGTIAYRVEVTDDAGNTGVSGTTTYVQSSSGTPLWENLGCGTKGFQGFIPYLQMSGSQTGGNLVSFALTDARPSSLALTWLSFASTPFNAIGGTIYAAPLTTQVAFTTTSGGTRHVTTTWPAGLPPGVDHYWQVLVADVNSPHGLTMSNAVHGLTP
jgi:hypothetical protein